MYLKGPIKAFIANLRLGIRSAMAAWPHFSSAGSSPSTPQELCEDWSPVGTSCHRNIRQEVKNKSFQQSSICNSQHTQRARQMHQTLNFFQRPCPLLILAPRWHYPPDRSVSTPLPLWPSYKGFLKCTLRAMIPPKPTPKAMRIPDVILNPNSTLSATVVWNALISDRTNIQQVTKQGTKYSKKRQTHHVHTNYLKLQITRQQGSLQTNMGSIQPYPSACVFWDLTTTWGPEPSRCHHLMWGGMFLS